MKKSSNKKASIKSSQKLSAAEQSKHIELRKSKIPFIQLQSCYKLQRSNTERKNISVCRDCSLLMKQPKRNPAPDDYNCRFYEFRRLVYDDNGHLHVMDFCDPHSEPTREDIAVWQPDDETEPTAGFMSIEVCRYILLHIGDQFCYIWSQEAEALQIHENPNNIIAWKKAVNGIREMCDVCDMTLFNFHWICEKCAFSVCLDCFKDRKENITKLNDISDHDRDDFHWFLCTSEKNEKNQLKVHKLNELMLTKIIPKDCLNDLGRTLHEMRAIWQIPHNCDCQLSNGLLDRPTLKSIIDDLIRESRVTQRRSVASETEERLQKLNSQKIEFNQKIELNYETELNSANRTLSKDPIAHAFDDFKGINLNYESLAGRRVLFPTRSMIHSDSKLLAPGVPHQWLCDGKLLHLTDAKNPDNRILFQEVWKCGQPVIISKIDHSLNLDLWRPDSFCRDFGEQTNDLVNCLNGDIVPNLSMKHFWEGFQYFRKRLLDANKQPMLLRLNDWPPGDDFAELLPTHYANLMNGIPLPEYTLRNGNLNLACCLPNMFLPPDLGPKMYNGYGVSLHPDKGTTNLHLDISDAVNIMVHVGIAKDVDIKSQTAACLKAISLGGCDYFTHDRALSEERTPGALWHIFSACDADKIRKLLNKVTIDNGFCLEPDHDPIHDQNWYLDNKLRERLSKEYGVKPYSIVQCLGDAVFIPAGAPHQVQNLHNCIKIAEDFVSPENITHCCHLMYEFRRLSSSHTNHEDKLQIKNIIYHAVKDCCTILSRALENRIKVEADRKRLPLKWQTKSGHDKNPWTKG